MMSNNISTPNPAQEQGVGAPEIDIEITPTMIEAGADVLMGRFDPDHYGNDRRYRDAARAAYRAMVSKRSQK
jgi:hypothetical protein